jgi:hypothetical protein
LTITTIDTVKVLLGTGAVEKTQLASFTDLPNQLKPNNILLLSGTETVMEFIRLYPASETNVPVEYAWAMMGALSTFHGIPVVTDMYLRPADRLMEGIWLIA